MKLHDFTEALESKYSANTSTSSKVLNESYSLVGQDGNAFSLMGYTARCMKECGLKNEIPEMREKATSGDYNNLIYVCDTYIQKCNNIAKDLDESLNEVLNESEEKWVQLNNIPRYRDVADNFECNERGEIRNAKTGKKYKAVSSNGGYFDLKYTIKLKNGKLTSIAKDKLVNEIENSFIFNDLGESLDEALNITRSKEYPTKFGTFIIVTKEGKARRMDSMTGKKEWKPVKNSVGYFEDFPEAVEFFLYKDGPNRFVSSSQGHAIDDNWEEFLNAKNYDDALKIVEPEVVKCFQDYYQDDSIY